MLTMDVNVDSFLIGCVRQKRSKVFPGQTGQLPRLSQRDKQLHALPCRWSHYSIHFLCIHSIASISLPFVPLNRSIDSISHAPCHPKSAPPRSRTPARLHLRPSVHANQLVQRPRQLRAPSDSLSSHHAQQGPKLLLPLLSHRLRNALLLLPRLKLRKRPGREVVQLRQPRRQPSRKVIHDAKKNFCK